MKWSYQIARIAGIEVRVHVTFLLILLFYGALFYQSGGLSAAVIGVAFVLALFFCVLLHEFGHAFAARGFGIRTPDITLLPIGGVARLERMPTHPWQELVIAVAGPAVNVAIALILLPIVGFQMRDLESLDSAAGGFLGKLMGVNILLVVFNMIPAFPMDGGRVLRALIATRLSRVKATQIAARVGQGVAILFAGYGLIDGNPILVLIAVFVFMGAQQELEAVRFMDTATTRRVSEFMTSKFDTLPLSISEPALREFVGTRGQAVFPVVDDSLRLVGIVKRNEILSQTGATQVQRVPAVQSNDPVGRALAIMQSAEQPILPVLNISGQVVGMISRAAIIRR